MGLLRLPQFFSRRWKRSFKDYRVTVYINDILITVRNDEEHLETLEKVLSRLQEYGLRLKWEKCYFMQLSVEYLRYIVDKDGLHATPAKVEAVIPRLLNQGTYKNPGSCEVLRKVHSSSLYIDPAFEPSALPKCTLEVVQGLPESICCIEGAVGIIRRTCPL